MQVRALFSILLTTHYTHPVDLFSPDGEQVANKLWQCFIQIIFNSSDMACGLDVADLFRRLDLRDSKDFVIKIRRDVTIVEEIIFAAGKIGYRTYDFDFSKPYTTKDVTRNVGARARFSGLPHILYILRIQNPYLYAAFLLKKQQKGGTATVEKLFHGTRIENVEPICTNNLNYRLRGRYGHLGNKYGNGVSFSPSIEYAKMFPRRVYDKKAMFIVRVMKQGHCTGSLGLEIPPTGMDTSISRDGNVWVKYCDNEFYPAYVAYYSS
ncbi:unnamed protein product [Acanthoscelides obtectus]|uniref:PARP catalytic domain-containing protein n=1 Tax=Acanthoscelides obtectus TaxID=200917 RepID=A0A9P0LDW8_ACAOB|nr:unnamed protein product [Acanthoscelides obtectus]CAK1658880.1 Poly [ADP-ribose] polymerase 12 [Acanthoscelides obtectus]